MQTENTAQASNSDPTMDSKPQWWTDDLDERQRKEIAFAHEYVSEFHHGTDGHHRLMLISALATALDSAWNRLGDAGGITVKLHEELTRLRKIAERDQDTKKELTKRVADLRHEIWEINPAHRDACAHTWLLQGTIEKGAHTTPIDEFRAIYQLESVLSTLDEKGHWHSKLAGFATLNAAMGHAAKYLMRYTNCTNGEAYAMMRAGMAVLDRMQGSNPAGHGY